MAFFSLHYSICFLLTAYFHSSTLTAIIHQLYALLQYFYSFLYQQLYSPCLVSLVVVAKYPTTTLFFLLGPCCFFIVFLCCFFAGSLSPLSTFGFSPNGLSLNFCQDFLGFFMYLLSERWHPPQDPTTNPLEFLLFDEGRFSTFHHEMRGIQCFSHNEGDLVPPDKKALPHFAVLFLGFARILLFLEKKPWKFPQVFKSPLTNIQ